MGDNGKKEWWDLFTVAQYLGWSYERVKKWTRLRRIPGLQQPHKGCKCLYDAEKVRKWAETLDQT